MTNKIERLYFGSQSSPVTSGDLVAGTYKLSHNSSHTTDLPYNANDATVEGYAEGLPGFGPGTLNVTATANGFLLEYTGALADTDVANDFSATDVLIGVAANTITVQVAQSGIASVPCVPTNQIYTAAVSQVATTPSNNMTTSAVQPVNEVQTVSFGGAASGTFDLTGNSTQAQVDVGNSGSLQTALDTIWGSGNTVAADLGGGSYSVTFQGSLAATPIDTMSVINNATDGTPSVSPSVEGTTGVHQVDQCTFSSGNAVAGSLSWGGSPTAYDSTPSTGGATMSGTAASGLIQTTWDDYSSHTPVYVESISLLSVVGVAQVDRCTFDSVAVGGSFVWDGGPMLYTDTPTFSNATVTGSAQAGLIETTWPDFGSHTPATVSTGTLASVNGRPHIITVTLSDSPTSGSLKITVNGGDSSPFDFDASSMEVETALQMGGSAYQCAVSGSDGGPWTITSDENIAAPTITAAEVNPLIDLVGIEIVVIQEGSAAPGGGEGGGGASLRMMMGLG